MRKVRSIIPAPEGQAVASDFAASILSAIWRPPINDATAGRFVWYELMTTDPKAAMDFYTAVIGWKTQPFAEGTPPGDV